MTIKIKLQIAIAAISPLLSFPPLLDWFVLDGQISGSSDDLETLNGPNVSSKYVKCVIINDNFSHPENGWLP